MHFILFSSFIYILCITLFHICAYKMYYAFNGVAAGADMGIINHPHRESLAVEIIDSSLSISRFKYDSFTVI